jgi:hypothetical protein
MRIALCNGASRITPKQKIHCNAVEVQGQTLLLPARIVSNASRSNHSVDGYRFRADPVGGMCETIRVATPARVPRCEFLRILAH